MYVKQGDYMVIVGPVSGKDARYKEFESGATVADFSVRYDKDPGGEIGAKQGKYIDVKCWRELSECARHLERGDVVLVAGKLMRDKRKNDDGNDRWYLNAETCVPQAAVTLMVQHFSEILMLVEMIPALEELAKSVPGVQNGGVFDENVPDDDPLPDSFTKGTEFAGDYPEVLE